MTTVIHCRYSAGAPADQYVYCGRPSKWGNHVGLGKPRAEAIAAYREWFHAPEQTQLRLDAVRELHNKVLGCWCAPKPCHAQIIADYVNRYIAQLRRIYEDCIAPGDPI